ARACSADSAVKQRYASFRTVTNVSRIPSSSSTMRTVLACAPRAMLDSSVAVFRRTLAGPGFPESPEFRLWLSQDLVLTRPKFGRIILKIKDLMHISRPATIGWVWRCLRQKKPSDSTSTCRDWGKSWGTQLLACPNRWMAWMAITRWHAGYGGTVERL